jgi:hypothetical protein
VRTGLLPLTLLAALLLPGCELQCNVLQIEWTQSDLYSNWGGGEPAPLPMEIAADRAGLPPGYDGAWLREVTWQGAAWPFAKIIVRDDSPDRAGLSFTREPNATQGQMIESAFLKDAGAPPPRYAFSPGASALSLPARIDWSSVYANATGGSTPAPARTAGNWTFDIVPEPHALDAGSAIGRGQLTVTPDRATLWVVGASATVDELKALAARLVAERGLPPPTFDNLTTQHLCQPD